MKSFLFAVGLMVLGSSAAHAQATGAAVPGGANAAGVASGNREQNASYNRLVGERSQRPVRKGQAIAALPTDVRPGSALRDVKGVPVGTVETVEAEAAIVSTMAGRVRIPLIGFGKDDIGLMLSMTAAELGAAVTKATAAP